MHVLFIVDNFPPESNPPAIRTYEHATNWVRMGAKVTIITCNPNFPYGKIYPGFKNTIYSRSSYDDITVIRVWSFISKNKGVLIRLLDFVSFMLTSFIAGVFVKNVDVIVGTSPQILAAQSACMLSFLKRKPFILEIRDLWPESIDGFKSPLRKPILYFGQIIANKLYDNAYKVVVVTEAFKKILVNKGLHQSKIKVITNGVNLKVFERFEKNFKKSMPELSGRFIVGYIGSHQEAHCLDTLLNVAEKAKSDKNCHDIFFLTVGTGSEQKRLSLAAQERGLDNLKMIGHVPREQIVNYWRVLDLSILHLKDTPVFNSVLPSKLFESIAAKVPVMCGVKGEAKRLIEREKIGLYFNPEDDIDLLRKIIYLRESPPLMASMKERCKVSSKKFDREQLARKMYKILKECV